MRLTIPWLAVFIAAISAFPLGYLWYGPLFGKTWQALTGMTEEKKSAANMPAIFGVSFLLNLIAALVLSQIIGTRVGPMQGLFGGIVIGLGLVAGSYAISYLFAQRATSLILIDGGYMAARIALMGLILGWLG